MKTIILAGGRGTRIAEETVARPKPMVEIGGKPILWHIMQIYASFGYKDFLVACGYKGEMIKEYFHNYYIHNSDSLIDLQDGSRQVYRANKDDWRVGLIDTGIDTSTGGRILRLQQFIGQETFLVTYGDGVGDIDIRALVKFHHQHGKKATVTAVRPPARFGGLELEGDTVKEFSEKPQTGEGWINGGFFVFESEVFNYLNDDSTILEREPLEQLARDGELCAYRHEGFWHPMDTLRDRLLLEECWVNKDAPWKVWKG
jgi:glucose-1-phosphate cytidylyltransferase